MCSVSSPSSCHLAVSEHLHRIGLILAFTIPRVPGLTLNQQNGLVTAGGSFNRSIPSEFSRFPANFSFPAYSPLEFDTTGNYLPLAFNHIRAQVFDLSSDRLIGVGYIGKEKIPAKAFPVIMMPLNFSYVADNDTDPTCKLSSLRLRELNRTISRGFLVQRL